MEIFLRSHHSAGNGNGNYWFRFFRRWVCCIYYYGTGDGVFKHVKVRLFRAYGATK